ncbi:MAG: hypothetical protein V4787_11795 [Pseudomonadota bacterium]
MNEAKDMKDWKIVVSGTSKSAEGTEETARAIVREARIAGLQVDEALVTYAGNTSSIGVDEPGMSREAALGAANHPDPFGVERTAQQRREIEAAEAAERLETTQRDVQGREVGEVTHSRSALSGDTTKADVSKAAMSAKGSKK